MVPQKPQKPQNGVDGRGGTLRGGCNRSGERDPLDSAMVGGIEEDISETMTLEEGESRGETR